MSDAIPLFDDADEDLPRPQAQPVMMTATQRAEIKDLFGRLGIAVAREQFRVIYELTGNRINNVGELQAAQAHRAIDGLRKRVAALGSVRTGNSWDDREEPTWIDNL